MDWNIATQGSRDRSGFGKAGLASCQTSGDHRVFRSSDGRITVVSGRLGDDVRPGTYRAILRANWYRGRHAMTRKYSLVMEGGPTGYSAYVPELPSILVTGDSTEELTARAREAIQLYWEVLRADRSPTATLCEIEVELPA